MAGFLLRGAALTLKATPKVAKGTVQGIRYVAPVVVKPTVEFTKGVVRGAPKYIPIAGTQGVKQATVGVFLRAGIQTRQVTVYVVKAAVVKGPVTAVRLVWAAPKTVIRDAMYPGKIGLYAYHGFRGERLMRGATSALERRIDKFIPIVGRYLDKVGLAPTFRGTVASSVRWTGYIALGTTAYSTADKLHDYYQYLAATTQHYVDILNVPRAGTTTVVPVPVSGTGVPVHQVPVVNVQPVGTPIIVSPPVGVSSKGIPVIITPVVRRK